MFGRVPNLDAKLGTKTMCALCAVDRAAGAHRRLHKPGAVLGVSEVIPTTADHLQQLEENRDATIGARAMVVEELHQLLLEIDQEDLEMEPPA